ncbi:MAG: mucoidy inhibitor MuiA family protein [Spirochaetales bacterium]|nr:mucoidy inhibitor MuiA family protein [Spirochaetales bacterium]
MNDIQTSFKIDEITVYPGTARITRTDKLKFAKGENRLFIRDLPASISEESIRFELAKKNGLSIRDIYSEEVFISNFDENRLRELKSELDGLYAEKSRLEAEYYNLFDEYNLFVNKKAILSSVQPSVQKSIVVNNWGEFLEFLHKRLKKNRDSSRDIIFKWIDLLLKIKAAEKNLTKFSSLDRVKERRIVVIVESSQETEEKVLLHYFQGNCNWYPAYMVRGDTRNKKLSITMFAMVTQSTGEDWEDTALHFSTAVPMENCSIPELKSRRIRESDTDIPVMQPSVLAEPEEEAAMDDLLESVDMEKGYAPKLKAEAATSRAVKTMNIRKAKKIRDMDKMDGFGGLASGSSGPGGMMDEVINEEPELKESKELRSEIGGGKQMNRFPALRLPSLKLDCLSGLYRELYDHTINVFSPERNVPPGEEKSIADFFKKEIPVLQTAGGFDYRYKAASARNFIPTGGSVIQVGLDIIEWPIDLIYTTIPSARENVYLKAMFKNSGPSPLLSGPAQIYAENNFLGNIIFPTIASNQSSYLSLGLERDIKVIRREEAKRRTGGFVKKEIVTDFRVEIEIVSYKEKPVRCEIFDRIPVSSKKKEITVMDETMEPAPDVMTERKVLVYNTKLEPKVKKILKFGYSVKHPEDYRLTMYYANHPHDKIEEKRGKKHE